MNADATVQDPYQLTWIRSSYSSEEGGECVEVATDASTVHIRDSKDTTRCTLTASSGAWAAFVDFSISHAP
ncbi:DUF397 domain-containing protein [Streptomyces noursei]|uniref:Toxin-antitoxin system, toxin component n=1 Tax=Streptomyces noursei TaxID=1971 RepID=A0A2N8PCD7_STRNR|nr:DUF397 domain-containing protein [Streptomyces noursei]PNE38666.1 toxin-antitoxin system, toxin component [Streptomyces noursei]